MHADASHTPDAPPEPTPWIYVGWQLLVLVPSAIVVPAFDHGRYVALPGTLLAVLAAAVCVWAFVRCPRRAVVPKAVTFVLLLPALYVGLACITSYLTWGLS